jgi:drug/metabolite transporter (DMT)-like permease
VLLNERLEPGFIVGALAVFAGIMLVSAHQWVARWLLRAAGVRQAK